MKRFFLFSAGLATLPLMAAVVVGCGSDDADGESNGGAGGTGGAAGMAGTGATGGAGTTGGTGGTGGTSATGGTAGEAGTGATGGTAGAAGAGGNPVYTRKTISGSATWSVTFDADAKAAGATDCAYTRQYEGVQDHSKPWVCLDCEVIFRTTVQMTAGADDCFPQISEAEPPEEEWVGYANGTWYRTAYFVVEASDQGTATLNGDAVTLVNDAKDMDADIIGAGKFGFDIEGSFTLGEEDGDPLHGWVAANNYACAWGKNAPVPYTGDYSLAVGQTLPDGLMRDKCDDIYRMHDAKGSYVVVFLSAMNCPACNTMASQEPAFIEEMAGKGIDVTTITIMQPSLNDPFGDTTKAQLEYWSTKHGIETPVLADRGLGLFMFLPLYPEELGYPAWIVADPDLKVLRYGTAVDWVTIRNTITADAN